MKKILVVLIFLNLLACSGAPKKQVVTLPTKTQEPKSISNKTELDELDLAIANGDFDLIKKIASKLLQEDSKNLKALNALAMFYYQKKQYKAATLLLNKYMNYSKSESGLIFNNLALVAIGNGDKKQAIIQFKKAWDLNPDNEFICYNLASIYLAEHEYEKAKLILDKLALQGRLDLNAKNNYGVALAATGNLIQAENVYKSVLQIDTNNKKTLYNLAILYIDGLGKPKDGLDLLSRLKFVGIEDESLSRIKELENKAKEGLK